MKTKGTYHICIVFDVEPVDLWGNHGQDLIELQSTDQLKAAATSLCFNLTGVSKS